MKARIILPLIILILMTATCFAKEKRIPIEEALKKKVATIKVRNVKGFKGKCLNLKAENLTEDSLYLVITPGWIFDSDDSTKQDLMVVKEMMFSLSKHESKIADIAVNCCQRTKHSPAGSKFSRYKKSNKELSRLAEFISKEDFTDETICQAVWAVSDKSPIANICGSGESKDEMLRNKVAQITGRYIPWYRVKTQNKEFEDGHIETYQTSLYGEFDCHMTKGTEYSVKLTDKKGREIMTLSPVCKAKEDVQNYYVEFSVAQLPQKEFFITFFDPYGVEIMKKPFDLRL